jgi:ribosomal protein S18 acetylase RimI-like enzyme
VAAAIRIEDALPANALADARALLLEYQADLGVDLCFQEGRTLVDRVLEEAARARYQRVVLDTLPSMTSAQALYRSLGFAAIAAYCHNPVCGTRYFALSLQ